MRRRVLLAGGLGIAGCAAPPVARPVAAEALVFLAEHGWHTEAVVPDAGGRWVSWGFGARGFFTSPSPGLPEFLAALTPGPAAIVATPEAPRPGAVALPVSEAGLAAMRAFLHAELLHTAEGVPVLLGPGFRPGGVFFAARRPYSLAYTCNSWTMEVLAAGGVPVRSSGTLTAADAMAQARRAAGMS
jgi:hypothetical protein